MIDANHHAVFLNNKVLRYLLTHIRFATPFYMTPLTELFSYEIRGTHVSRVESNTLRANCSLGYSPTKFTWKHFWGYSLVATKFTKHRTYTPDAGVFNTQAQLYKFLSEAKVSAQMSLSANNLKKSKGSFSQTSIEVYKLFWRSLCLKSSLTTFTYNSVSYQSRTTLTRIPRSTTSSRSQVLLHLTEATKLLFFNKGDLNFTHKKTLALRAAKIVLSSQELIKDVCPELIYPPFLLSFLSSYSKFGQRNTTVHKGISTRAAFLPGKTPRKSYRHLSLLLECYTKGRGQLISFYLLLGLSYLLVYNTNSLYRCSHLNFLNQSFKLYSLGVAAPTSHSLLVQSYQGELLSRLKPSIKTNNPSVPVTQGFMHYQFHQLCTLERIFIFTPLRLGSLGVTKHDKNSNNSSVSSQWGVSVSQLFSAARWLEREAVELFGVQLVGMLDQRNLLLQYGETSSPLKKAYPSSGWYEVYYIPVYNTLVERFLTQGE